MLVNATAMLQAAEKGHYGLGAFNTNNLEWASSILDAAEELQSPVIIQCTGGAAKWQISYRIVADIVKDLVEDKGITVPVALHLDHGSYDDVFKCIDAGFTSPRHIAPRDQPDQRRLPAVFHPGDRSGQAASAPYPALSRRDGAVLRWIHLNEQNGRRARNSNRPNKARRIHANQEVMPVSSTE